MQKQGSDLKKLIKGCLNNEHKCEQLLYKTFYGYVSGVGFRYLKENEMIKELVNDSFVKIFSKLQDFHFIGDEPELSKVFKGWIGKITANLAIDKIRAHKRLVYIEEEIPDHIMQISVQAENRLAYNDIIVLLDALPPLQRVIFNMHAIEGFSHEEIAKELNMLPNTSRVYLKRAKAKLVELYQSQENEQRTRARIF